MLSNAVRQLCRQCQQFALLSIRCSCPVVPRPLQAAVDMRSWTLNTPVRFAGHSHWQNIKKTKAEKDDQRQKTINRVIQRVRTAAREGGSTDPKVNSQLARALEDGKSKDVPNATMLETLRKMEKAKEMKGSVMYVEGKALGSCFVIVEMLTDRPKRARHDVQYILKKFGGTIGESGMVQSSFNFKGVVYVCNDGEKTLTKDEALEKAIEAGAEEVLEGFDDEDKPALKFICDTKELHVVKKALDDNGLITTAARLEFVPHTFTLLKDAALDAAANMREALENIDEVVRVFDNVSSADETS